MSLTVIIGPMFSGKTTYLIDLLTRYADLNMSVLYVNSSKDTRTDVESKYNHVTTHNSQFTKLSHKIESIKCDNIAQVVDILDRTNYNVIGIDECLFFDDLTDNVKRMFYDKDKIVICSSLDSDYKMKPIGKILDLIPMADTVIKLNSKCMHCLKAGNPSTLVNAPYTAKIDHTDLRDVLEAAGKESYIPLCLKHYKKFMSN
jgi:thymidine kinase